MRIRTLAVLLAFDAAGFLLAGCSGTTSSSQQSPTITTQPANQTVTVGQSASFSVTATGATPLTYQWQKNGSPISSATNATYSTPPSTSADNGAQFVVVVSNAKGSATSNPATLTVTAASSVQITTTSLPSGQVQTAYSATLQAAGGTTPYTWSVSSGSLPVGLTLTGGSGAISGTPTTTGTSSFTIQVADSAGNKASAGFSIAITGGTGSVKTVFIILMENHNWSDITATAAPYINNTLLPMGAHASQYYNPPGNHPSEPNYIWLEAGSNLGLTTDADPSTSNELTTTSHLVTLLNNANISWKAYDEDISGSTCPLVSSGGYAAKHNPFVFFANVTNNLNPASAYCIAHIRPYTELATDLANNTVASYNFITPNLVDDMHDSDVPTGDTWLSQNVPAILNSAAYKQGGALFITWDEAGSGDGPIGMIVLSPNAKVNYQNIIHYDHSSTVKTMEEIFHVTPLLNHAGDATTNDLSDLFVSFP